MIELVLAGYDPGSYTVVAIPDLDDGPRWRAMVAELLGPLDRFFTDNPYVTSLLTGCYRVARPVTLVAAQDRVPIDGTMVRRAMAEGEGWQELVPTEVADYLVAEGLDRRFRRQFGLQTLALPVTQPITGVAGHRQPVRAP
jgi:nicotinamide mononucleotide adenylyltransferase